MRKKTRGFTLIEVLVASALLAGGLIMVYEAFFTSLNAYREYGCFLDVHDWVLNTISAIEAQVITTKSPPNHEPQGIFTKGGKEYEWAVNIRPVVPEQLLYEITVTVERKILPRRFEISRSAYVSP